MKRNEIIDYMASRVRTGDNEKDKYVLSMLKEQQRLANLVYQAFIGNDFNKYLGIEERIKQRNEANKLLLSFAKEFNTKQMEK